MTYSRDIAGQVFGHLTAISIVGKYRRENIWRCLCVCGKETDVRLTNLRTGNTASCGCMRFKADICAND